MTIVPSYEQRLLALYDVANYTRNLLNTPLIVYSGQKDAQMQAALVMQVSNPHLDRHPHLILTSSSPDPLLIFTPSSPILT